LLLDEPLGALDAKLREDMQVELINLQKDVGVTFVFVTHSQAEALALSHRIAVMNQGRVEQLDAPADLYSFPKNRFVADFIGKINMLEAEVLGSWVGPQGAPCLKLRVEGVGDVLAPSVDGVEVGLKGAFAVRPEQIQLSAEAIGEAPNRVAGKILDFLYVGDVTTYIVALDNGTHLEALLPNSGPGAAHFFKPGDSVVLSWRADVGVFLR
jgi:spermidine/putrescine transport system ATP-binding protein